MISDIFSFDRMILYAKLFFGQSIKFCLIFFVILIIAKRKKKEYPEERDHIKVLWSFKELFCIFILTQVIYYLTLYFIPLFTINRDVVYFLQEASSGILLIIVILVYFYNTNVDDFKLLMKLPIKKKGLFIAIAISLVFVTIYPLVAVFIPKDITLKNILFYVDSIAGITRAFIIYCIFIPIAEELYFRGLFYNLLRNKIGIKMGIIMSAILFSVLHDFGIIAFILIQGLILGYLFEKSESILMPFLFHSYNNLIILILSVYNGYIYKHFSLIYYVCFMAFTIGIAYTIYLIFFSKEKEVSRT